MRQAAEAHGGSDRWQSFETLTLQYREHWSWPFTWVGENPWPHNDAGMRLKLWLHEARAECVFERHPGWTWRWQDGLVTVQGQGLQPKLNWNPEFVLPRTHYLTLLPFKLLDRAARLEYIGKRDGHDGILVTFPPGAGDTPRDRYWAWFDESSGQLDRMILTVTAYGPLAVGDLRYEDYREIQGLRLPTRIRASLNGTGAPLHVGEYAEALFE